MSFCYCTASKRSGLIESKEIPIAWRTQTQKLKSLKEHLKKTGSVPKNHWLLELEKTEERTKKTFGSLSLPWCGLDGLNGIVIYNTTSLQWFDAWLKHKPLPHNIQKRQFAKIFGDHKKRWKNTSLFLCVWANSFGHKNGVLKMNPKCLRGQEILAFARIQATVLGRSGWLFLWELDYSQSQFQLQKDSLHRLMCWNGKAFFRTHIWIALKSSPRTNSLRNSFVKPLSKQPRKTSTTVIMIMRSFRDLYWKTVTDHRYL